MAITAGTWVPVDQIGLNQKIDEVSTTRHYPIGHRVKCRDVGSTDYGEAEFVYTGGVASCAAGDLVVFDGNVVLRAVPRAEGPCGVAMAAVVASSYGWFQVTGVAKIACDTTADNAQLYIDATTAGAVDDAAVAGDMVHGARSMSADDTGFLKAIINHPCVADADDA